MSITPLPSAPVVSDSTATFNAKAFAMVQALAGFITEINAAIPNIDLAVPASQVALAAANFKGDYSTLTGALSIPASCYYSGKIWVLVTNTSNVVSDVPGVSAKWTLGGSGFTWNTVKAAGFTASAMNGYPVNTTGGAITATLPAAASLGDTITLTDYLGTFKTNNLTINPNGLKINGSTSNIIVNTAGASVTLVYIDATQGWMAVSGFQNSPIGSYSANYLVVGAGGGGAGSSGGAGGAGGVLTGSATLIPGNSYTITIGAGGAGGTSTAGTSGSSSSISGIATALGGGGGGYSNITAGASGGSGGGGGSNVGTAGSGTGGQGFAGGAGSSAGAGGGGASAAGNAGTNSGNGNGGAGVSNSISGAAVTYGGGGGGGGNSSGSWAAGNGGAGGGGNGGYSGAGVSGTANTGGGGGGGGYNGTNQTAGNGGSGVVIISYAGTQRATGGTVTSSGGFTIHTFTSSGTFTA